MNDPLQAFSTDPLDKCMYITERIRHARLDELMLSVAGLSSGQPPVLFELCRNDGCTQRKLSQQMFIRPSSLTPILQRMEQTGLVRREADARDQRITRVFLTDAGRKKLCDCTHVFERMEQEAFDGFSPEETMLFRRLLHQICVNITRRKLSAE